MTDNLGDAIMKEMTLSALQLATLNAALRRIDEIKLTSGERLAGVVLAREQVQALINEIEGETHV